MTARSLRAAALAASLGAASLSAQQTPLGHRYERPMTASVTGPQRLAVDGPLLIGSSPFTEVVRSGRDGRWRAYGGLADLRLYHADGREIPYLLVYPPAGDPEWVSGSVLPLAATEKTSGFEADLGAAETVDTIRVEGLPPPFLKRLVLEGSGDRSHWTMLAAEGTLFDLPQERIRQVALPFRAGSYRYLRVTWNDANSGRMPLPRAVAARRATLAGPTDAPLTISVPIERRPSEPGRSRYHIRLPAPSLPIVALVLDVGSGHVFRDVTVTESRLTSGDPASGAQVEAAPSAIGRARIVRVVRGDATAGDLRIPISPPREAELDLVVDDGNNPPLDVRRVSIELAELPWIYFESNAGAVIARYGDRTATRPTYDLEAARAGLNISALPVGAWAEVRAIAAEAPEAAPPPMPDVGAPLDPSSFRFQRPLADGGTGLVALPMDVAALAHSAGPASRFADVRVLDDAGRQVPYLVERREEPLTVDLELRQFEPKAAELRSQTGHTRSVYAVRLPYAQLPGAQLVIESPARVFRRSVRVGVERPPDRQRREAWFEEMANVHWEHANQNAAAPALLLPIHATGDGEVLVVVDEGDNSPLPLSAARLLLPSYRLRFFRPQRPLRLVYGRADLGLPRYDLALLAPQVMGAEAREVSAAPEQTASAVAPPSFISPAMFWIGLGVAVLLMLGLIAKLVARAE